MREDGSEALMPLREVAALVDGRLDGDPDLEIRGVAPVDQAGPGELGLLAARRYLRGLERCRAGALLVSEELAPSAAAVPNRVVVEDAHLALARLLDRLHPPEPIPPGVHPTAVLGRGVHVGDEVTVGPYAVIEDEVVIGDRARVGAHVCVGRGATVGADSVLHPQVVIYPGAEVGERVVLHAGARIGVDGFGYVFQEGRHRKVPQVGDCVVEDDVEIGANTCIDRGSIGRTVVGTGSKLDNLVHLGHNVTVGAGSLMAAMVGVAGSSHLGKGIFCGGQVGISGHLEIGDGARLGAQAGIIGDVPPGETVSGYPARPHRKYLRAMSHVFRLPELAARVNRLEQAAEAAESKEGRS